jgi:E3 ubiquitin-protein ligase MARCH5
MWVVDAVDLLVGRLCPYIAGGIGVGSLYWTCVTFGAVTIMQVRHLSFPIKLKQDEQI